MNNFDLKQQILIDDLINYINDESNFLNDIKKLHHPHLREIFMQCYDFVNTKRRLKKCDDSFLYRIERVSSYLHEKLHMGIWSEVDENDRRCFTIVSFVKAILILFSAPEISAEVIKRAIKSVDNGFLLGLPLKWNVGLLTLSAKRLNEELLSFANNEVLSAGVNEEVSPYESDEALTASRHFTSDEALSAANNEGRSYFVSDEALKASSNEGFSHLRKTRFDVKKRPSVNQTDSSAKKIKINDFLTTSKCKQVCEIDVLNRPSLEEFYVNYFLTQKPLIIRGCMSHWPAITKWKDVVYLIKIAGERTVPVEIGSSYSSTDFSQKLMTIKDFIKNYYNDDSAMGYLAQHDLLSQVPELREDVRLPEYCALTRKAEDEIEGLDPEINAWFGPKGTVSTLHYDPKDNLLCQVFGTKQILLFSPDDSAYLYPHDAMFLSNTAQVEPLQPDLIKYPLFKEATMFVGTLGESEMLFMPPKWWHHVTAMEKSFSVNFWWE